jgi:hypothetical protein
MLLVDADALMKIELHRHMGEDGVLAWHLEKSHFSSMMLCTVSCSDAMYEC